MPQVLEVLAPLTRDFKVNREKSTEFSVNMQRILCVFFMTFKTRSLAPILLKSFQRIALKKGESQTITFHLTSKELSMYNAALEEVVEPSDFKVMIGAASNDIRLEGMFSLQQ